METVETVGSFAFSALGGFVPIVNPYFLLIQLPLYIVILMVVGFATELGWGKAALIAYVGQALFVTFVGREIVQRLTLTVGKSIFPVYGVASDLLKKQT